MSAHDASDEGEHEDGHIEGTVCVYMADEAFKGWRARQVSFGSLISDPGQTYYEFLQDFNEPEMADGEIWVEDFSVGLRAWAGPTVGLLYFTADRNPDIISGHYNIRMYRNAD